ncbi:DUF6545 domain-containing protein [Cryobacterium sp. M15]|uniref:DUF6545 domain-containing protein n=1 Tax=Cryobacterium sp. M15 TaxID=2048291 RepID=UPI000CE3A31A|nr:DUF6545 domain-containing protein [Cryobacterium sp. M15]
MPTTVLIFAPVLLWSAALFCLPSAVRGHRRPLLWFLIVSALTLTLQPKPVYEVVDAFLGGINATYFLFHALAILAVALLDVIVQEAVSAEGITRNRRRASALVAGLIITAQATLFWSGDWRLKDIVSQGFVARWDFTLYASTTWIAMAFFAVSVSYACLSDIRKQSRVITRFSLVFVTLACLGVLLYALISLTSAAQSMRDPGFVFQGWPRVTYSLSLQIAPLSLAVGLGLTATVDGLISGRKTYLDRVLLWRITPMWHRLLLTAPDLSIDRKLTRPGLLVVRQPGLHLYRRYVEIRDTLLLDPTQAVSSAEQSIIDRVERQTQVPPEPIRHDGINTVV